MYYLSFVSYFSTSGESMHHLVEITGNEDKAFGKCHRYFNLTLLRNYYSSHIFVMKIRNFGILYLHIYNAVRIDSDGYFL